MFIWYAEGSPGCVMPTKEAGAPTDILKEEENHRGGAGAMKLLAMLAPWLWWDNYYKTKKQKSSDIEVMKLWLHKSQTSRETERTLFFPQLWQL